MPKIKVLIVEDSLVGQNLLKGLIYSDSRFELIGIAQNGRQAVEYIAREKPDVVSMDINMPVMDGVEATREIMQTHPVPIVIVSSFYNSSEVEMAMKVLTAGAVSILPRPFGPGHPKYAQTARQYLNMLKSMSEVKVVKRIRKQADYQNLQTVFSEVIKQDIKSGGQLKLDTFNVKIVLIGASAGGPEGIQTILSGLPENFPLPILIVQHIDANFAEGYSNWLNSTSNLPVHIAVNNDIMMPGHVYLPPGNKHIAVKSKGVISVSDAPPVKGLKPSVGVLFQSAADVYGSETLAILLSGMGRDGAAELKILRNLGAFTIAQDEQSCLVYGMPGEAVRMGAALKILPPVNIVLEINKLLS